MSAADQFTGERYIPGVVGEIAYEHCHRYAFARRFVAGRRVLDAACGEGYGAALLAGVAQSVIGIDIEPRVVAEASAQYGGRGNLRFEPASVTRLPLADGSVDVIVSFETIEHLQASDQPRMLAEFARVLAPDTGVRRLRFARLPSEPASALRALAAMLDTAIRNDPAAWHLWAQWPRFMAQRAAPSASESAAAKLR